MFTGATQRTTTDPSDALVVTDVGESMAGAASDAEPNEMGTSVNNSNNMEPTRRRGRIEVTVKPPK